jgi:rubredoxin
VLPQGRQGRQPVTSWRIHTPPSPTNWRKIALFLLCIMKTYQCVVCGYIYDEAQGWPQDGIPAGTKWEDVPDTWVCPDCGVAKADFEMVVI